MDYFCSDSAFVEKSFDSIIFFFAQIKLCTATRLRSSMYLSLENDNQKEEDDVRLGKLKISRCICTSVPHTLYRFLA